jgi:pimeloyl-ACP methyl ester carboxylesterase
MADFILVHGMWYGGWCWKKVGPLLRDAGHEVYMITLTGVGERGHVRYAGIDMNTHIQDVVSVLEFENLEDVVLVGHSLAGFMAPAVAERVPERIAHIVNIDGVLPVDGRSFKELMPDYWEDFRQRGRAKGDEWWSPPIPEWTFGIIGPDLEWMSSRLTPHPLKTWEMPLSFTSPAARSIPRTFIHCTEGASPEEITGQEKECAQMGWQYRQLATGHAAMITAPQELTELLLELRGESG